MSIGNYNRADNYMDILFIPLVPVGALHAMPLPEPQTHGKIAVQMPYFAHGH